MLEFSWHKHHSENSSHESTCSKLVRSPKIARHTKVTGRDYDTSSIMHLYRSLFVQFFGFDIDH